MLETKKNKTGAFLGLVAAGKGITFAYEAADGGSSFISGTRNLPALISSGVKTLCT